MSKLRLFIVSILIIIAVAACGGGDSSSEGSNEDNTDNAVDNENLASNGFDGSYNGMQNLVLSFDGVSEVAEIVADVTVDGNSILIDPLTANGLIANGTFIATTDRISTQGGLTCQFLLTYQGDISFEVLNGTISGTAICDQGVGNETLDVSGTISATR